ncbi:MAG: M1 family metallopeptidase [Gemmatimonadales bacterium]|nr:M1 family metallopeptidase [Gemmatimonadales bacterium]
MAAPSSLAAFALVVATTPLAGQQWLNAPPNPKVNLSSFRKLDEWPAPNEQRTADGRPGPKYWQQQVDYVIRATLDTVAHVLDATERVTYHNNAPTPLEYLWFQLDQNIDAPGSRANAAAPALPKQLSPQARRFLAPEPFDGGYRISRVAVVTPVPNGKPRVTAAEHVINGTMMKVLLPTPLAPGRTVQVEIDFHYPIPEQSRNGRGVRERVQDGWMYEQAQWFPRAAVFDDVNGWQTDQFLGQGEFYLNFGDYDVSLTVPHDHVVQATGVLQNPEAVLTAEQRRRLAAALAGDTPQFVLRADEVGQPGSRPPGTAPLTWRFVARNVRDFAWVSSRAYVWDAAGFRYGPGKPLVELHSLYPREAMPLWDKVSTRAIAQTMRTYGRMAFEYPYPKAVNVHGPVFGMEYPMIAFCGARPAPDGSYTPALERALISVTIHEVGHNWFPMIVASDERQWTWMDEGVNTFLQYYAEKDWDPAYPTQRGPAKNIVPYMKDPDQVPLMTESDLIHRQFGNNGYAKPAAGLVMLREQVLGPALFDQAFQRYARAWSFRHPQPQDFFRSLRDGGGETLNWFWRGWFYTTHANDQAVTSVEMQDADSLVGTTARGSRYARITVENRGGLVMPLHLEIGFADGTTERVKLPVDVWRRNERSFTYGFFTGKVVTSVVVDPDEAFADVNREDNRWSARPAPPPAS